MPEDGDPGLEARPRRHRGGHGGGCGAPFGHDDDPARLSQSPAFLDLLAKSVDGYVFLGQEDLFAPAGQGDLHGQPAALAAHHLDDEDTLEGRGRVPDLIQGIEGDIDGRVGADGVVDAGDVVVDRRRDADHREAVPLGQDPGPRERAVAADDDEAVDPPRADLGQGRLLPLCGEERLFPGRFEDGPAEPDDVGDGAAIEGNEVAAHEPLIAAHHPFDEESLGHGRADDGPDRGVDAAAVSGQNGDLGHGPIISKNRHSHRPV